MIVLFASLLTMGAMALGVAAGIATSPRKRQARITVKKPSVLESTLSWDDGAIGSVPALYVEHLVREYLNGKLLDGDGNPADSYELERQLDEKIALYRGCDICKSTSHLSENCQYTDLVRRPEPVAYLPLPLNDLHG